ncbi:MAG: S41 family peptidase [Proteobacteria bacterium]|nr:S41 family peptidase [Pseudomonadota bacterium]
MAWSGKGGPLGVVVAAAWLAAACAPVHLPAPADAVSPSLTQQVQPVPERPEAEVFAAGYATITEKYIEAVSAATLAMEGMRGLGAIDPALTVTRSEDVVVLAASELTIARFPAPADDDVEGWAALTAKVSAAGRRTSKELRTASDEKLYEAVFDGVLSSLDIFSRYAGAEEARRNREKRDGFDGIGIRVRMDAGAARVTWVLADTPAAGAGLRKGDRITHVDGVSVRGFTRHEVVRRLRGPSHSSVALTVRREGVDGPLAFEMERRHIVLPTVTERRDHGIIFLTVTSFNQRTASSVAAKLTKALEGMGGSPKGLVLDLRGNPGGLLKQSIEVADLFLTQGQIVRTHGRHPDSEQRYEADGEDMAHGLPLVVLVDGKSASAAEIVAAALQDHGRAVVIGTTSFGKGTVQTVIRLPNDGEITLTWSRLITPSGYVLHGLGVMPDICTSGATGDVRKLIAAVFGRKAKIAADRARWQTAGLGEKKQRRDLRATCPAERRRKALEIEVARRLLSDRALYGRALDLTAATSQAQY